MMFVLNSHIVINSPKNGDFSFSGVTEVRIKRSVGSMIDTCVLKLPTSARLVNNGQITELPETGSAFNRGDRIIVKLGYNGILKKEFDGFVKSISFSTPLEVECEGYAYLLRKKNIHQGWKQVELRQLCEYLVAGTGIKLGDNIPGMPIYNYTVHNATALKVLEDIVSRYKLTAYFVFDRLYVGLEEGLQAGSVTYRMGWNTADVNSLKYQHEDDVRMKVVAKTTKKDGERTLYEVGDADGEVREIIVKPETLPRIKAIADDYLKKFKYTGYRGSLTAFLQPYCEPSYTCKIIDMRYPERNGSYFVHAVEVSYGMSGGRRIIELTKKLST